MDKYESIHGKDVSSFDFSSTHRLPTVSAAQVFDDLEADSRQSIATGLEALDRALADVALEDGDRPQRCRGIQKGQITEVWGPPGSGKTTLAMQIAANTLRDGCGVVWVADTTANLVHYSTPTFAHLIALLCKPGASSFPRGTSLVVIDGLSGLVNLAFPKNVEPRQTPKGPGPATRRLQVLQFLVSALQKLAATQDLLVLVLSQCATRMQNEHGATISPAISASCWERGIATRLVLFQDWATVGSDLRSIRIIGVQKSNDQGSPNGIGMTFPFEIRNGGLVALDLETNGSSLTLATNTRHQKRKFAQSDFEIADSEGEDYGWEDEDEAEMPNMPPQWQGSEDLLLGVEEDANVTAELSESEEGPSGNVTPVPSPFEQE
ncbi:P-loop containing nucleoside triphosphate hydrolase protein [Nemania sp. NC0429]|nr:P-loop containing nucleoside triphosphate hydrolase protein [Nemania sp. NC0429]